MGCGARVNRPHTLHIGGVSDAGGGTHPPDGRPPPSPWLQPRVVDPYPATDRTPVASPSELYPGGRLIAGSSATLNGAVKGPYRQTSRGQGRTMYSPS